MKVFVDSSAWLALEIRNDIYHISAVKEVTEFKKQRALFFTNDYVLAEVYTRLIYDFHLLVASQFHEKIITGTKTNLTILEIDDRERTLMWQKLEMYKDHKLSFTDASVVVNFIDLNLDNIFSFDRHFRDINLPTNLG